jgi:hypothetical protein
MAISIHVLFCFTTFGHGLTNSNAGLLAINTVELSGIVVFTN